MLVLPAGVAITSGKNETAIGDLSGGDSATARWTVVFQQNETYTLLVQASGYDSNGYPCSASHSFEISAIPEFNPVMILPLFMLTTLLALAGYSRRRSCKR